MTPDPELERIRQALVDGEIDNIFVGICRETHEVKAVFQAPDGIRLGIYFSPPQAESMITALAQALVDLETE